MPTDEIDLSFPSIKYSVRSTPWTLNDLLHSNPHGKIGPSPFAGLGSSYKLNERRQLLVAIHDEINGALIGGGARLTAYNRIRRFKKLFRWADGENLALNLKTVENVYLRWVDHLLQNQRSGSGIKEASIYGDASSVSSVLDRILGRRTRLLGETRIRDQRVVRKALATSHQKQNLADTFDFGHLLVDVCNSLSAKNIRGPLPIKITSRAGDSIEHWSGLRDERTLSNSLKARDERRRRALREAWSSDTSFRTRHPVINLRIEAEMLLFIAETGMNLAQAHRITFERFHYTSHLDGYEVREYKARRRGEVAFEIRGEYKAHFETYLSWRSEFFNDSNTNKLFPFIRPKGRIEEIAPIFDGVKLVCKRFNRTFIGPRQLRHSRVNWLLRRSRDLELTADMAQHTRETLLRNYHEPHLQSAMVEISNFHRHAEKLVSPPGPGACVSIAPTKRRDTPAGATVPDCISPAGCLFCSQQRDIDSLDYVWALASFRYLKSIEQIKDRSTHAKSLVKHPTEEAINRISEKLRFYETSSPIRENWVKEALARIEEEHYHPYWDGFIRLQEL